MHTEPTDTVAIVDNVIRSRTTVRAFRPDSVPQAQLKEIIEVARMARATSIPNPGECMCSRARLSAR